MTTIPTRFQLRRGTAADMASIDEVMLAGEFGVEIDTGKAKIGDGATAWNSLPYVTWGLTGQANTWASAQTFSSGFRLGSISGPLVRSGSGTPEGAVSAPVGSLFLRTDGGAATTLYVKESGTGNTGWVAK